MSPLPPQLSEFGRKSQIPSPVNEMTGQFAVDFREGVDINLGVGYVNDATIPAGIMQQALSAVLSDPVTYRNPFNYGGAEGSPALRRAIRNYYIQYGIGNLTPSEVETLALCIGANGATSILDSFTDLIHPGIVITADPYYYIYCDTLQRKGFTVHTVPEDADGIRIDLLEDLLCSINPADLRFFYIVTVNNPSCTILSNHRKQQLVAIARTLSQQSGRQIPVLFDKAYEDIIHNETIEKPISGLAYDTTDLVFEIGTFSKVIAPALRIGYLFTKNRRIADLLMQKVSDIGFSAPLINQEITAWMLEHHIGHQREKVNRGYRDKAAELLQYLKETLGNRLPDVKGGDAGFYFYLTLPVETGKNTPFFRYLSRTTGDPHLDGAPEKLPRLIYIPGEICVNPKGPMTREGAKQVRISYGFETIDTIKEAVTLINNAIDYALGFEN